MADLAHGKPMSDAPGVVGVTRDELPPLPDAAITDREAGRLDPRRWFREPSRPFELEIGSGKGTFLLAHARANPTTNLLAIEWAYEFYLYAADRARRHALPNVRLLHADATEFLRWRCPASIVRVIHLYFSDPWPKAKHHKNRVVQDRFLADAWRALEPGGELRLVTDHDELWDWCRRHIARWTAPGSAALLHHHGVDPGSVDSPAFLERPFTPPPWAEADDEVVGTNYERKMCIDAPPHACTLVKPSQDDPVR